MPCEPQKCEFQAIQALSNSYAVAAVTIDRARIARMALLRQMLLEQGQLTHLPPLDLPNVDVNVIPCKPRDQRKRQDRDGIFGVLDMFACWFNKTNNGPPV